MIHTSGTGQPNDSDSPSTDNASALEAIQSNSSDLGDTPWINRQASEQATRAAQARQSSTRRRHIDPATSERNYDEAEIEFMNAMQDYKARSGRLFPTWSEVLEVLQDLGYQKLHVTDGLSSVSEVRVVS